MTITIDLNDMNAVKMGIAILQKVLDAKPAGDMRLKETKTAAEIEKETFTDEDLEINIDEKTQEKSFDLDSEVIPALRKYKAKHQDAGVKKVLSKFKVTSVRDLSAAKYPELMGLIS